jgi:hypothetical protein
MLINAKRTAPSILLSPVDVAYEGRYRDGKKYPNPCAILETVYTQNKGVFRKLQFA